MKLKDLKTPDAQEHTEQCLEDQKYYKHHGVKPSRKCGADDYNQALSDCKAA